MATLVQLAWLKSMVAPAQLSMRQTGVPASVTLAQAIMESAWGTSQLARRANNYFGIKAIPGQGYAEFTTREVVSGRSVMQMASFARYPSAIESFAAHGKLLSSVSRYQQAMLCTGNVPLFLEELQAGGYSTDPDYAEGLLGLIHQFNLTQYDTLASFSPGAAMETA